MASVGTTPVSRESRRMRALSSSRKRGHRLVAVAGVLGQGAVEDRLERGGRPRVQVADRAGRAVDDGVQDLDRVAAAEGRAAR